MSAKQTAPSRKRRFRGGNSVRAKALEERIRIGRELAASPTMTVTLRLPGRLNEWLDAYVHGAWPQKVRKQELVAEALRLLIAVRGGPGLETLSTDLLPDDSRG